jgi:hypothetical protein
MMPPVWFVKAIGLLDPLLSIRHSLVTSHWVIERQGIILDTEVQTIKRRRDRMWKWINYPNARQKEQIHQNRKEWQSLVDEADSAERQKRVICRPRVLNQGVYDDLCQSDFRRYGGYARYCTQMEQEEERREAEVERLLENKRKVLHGEVYDILKFLQEKKGSLLDRNEQDLHYMLHGTHATENTTPHIVLSDC